LGLKDQHSFRLAAAPGFCACLPALQARRPKYGDSSRVLAVDPSGPAGSSQGPIPGLASASAARGFAGLPTSRPASRRLARLAAARQALDLQRSDLIRASAAAFPGTLGLWRPARREPTAGGARRR